MWTLTGQGEIWGRTVVLGPSLGCPTVAAWIQDGLVLFVLAFRIPNMEITQCLSYRDVAILRLLPLFRLRLNSKSVGTTCVSRRLRVVSTYMETRHVRIFDH